MKEVIDFLISNDLYNVSENVEIAKGKYEIVNTFKGMKRKIKRAWLLKK